MSDLTELDKLEKYLKDHDIQYERIDQDKVVGQYGALIELERHQICVPVEDDERRDWDAICHYGSYGYDEGLLEIMGSLVNDKEDGDSVVGWLTADDVIERIEKKKSSA